MTRIVIYKWISLSVYLLVHVKPLKRRRQTPLLEIMMRLPNVEQSKVLHTVKDHELLTFCRNITDSNRLRGTRIVRIFLQY